MILTWLLILLVALTLPVVAFVLHQWLRLRRLRRRASVTEVAAWLGTLLRSFSPGTVLVAEPNGRAGFLQFALTQRERELRTLEFGLPETEWSRAGMAELFEILDSARVRWSIEAGLPGEAIQRFLRVEISGERSVVLQRASSLLPRIAVAMGHPTNQTYRVQMLGHEDPGYRDELATKLEALPTNRSLARIVAGTVRGRTGR